MFSIMGTSSPNPTSSAKHKSSSSVSEKWSARSEVASGIWTELSAFVKWILSNVVVFLAVPGKKGLKIKGAKIKVAKIGREWGRFSRKKTCDIITQIQSFEKKTLKYTQHPFWFTSFHQYFLILLNYLVLLQNRGTGETKQETTMLRDYLICVNNNNNTSKL